MAGNIRGEGRGTPCGTPQVVRVKVQHPLQPGLQAGNQVHQGDPVQQGAGTGNQDILVTLLLEGNHQGGGNPQDVGGSTPQEGWSSCILQRGW